MSSAHPKTERRLSKRRNMKGPDIVTDLQCCHGKCKNNVLSPIYLSVLKVNIIQNFKHLHRVRGALHKKKEKRRTRSCNQFTIMYGCKNKMYIHNSLSFTEVEKTFRFSTICEPLKPRHENIYMVLLSASNTTIKLEQQTMHTLYRFK